jgi:hypothetical protein
MDGRAVSDLGRHSGDPHAFPLLRRCRTEYDPDIGLSTQQVIQDAMGIMGHVQSSLQRLIDS